MSSFHFYRYRINLKLFPWAVRSVNKRTVPTQIFGNVQYPIVHKPVSRCAAWQTDMEEKQT